MTGGAPPPAEERVLSTLNRDGSRRWLRPRPSPGRFLTARRAVAYALIVLFTALPFVKIGGKPALLFDLAAREFTFFGHTFLPTDTLPLALLVLSIFVSIFLVTALFGRVWCGWACPQTVYMEFLFRPIERLLEGRHYRTSGRAPVGPVRVVAKYVLYLLASLYLAHTFLAYFVGVERLWSYMQRSPVEHPTAFLIVAATTGLMMLDFSYFREQVCTLMCPYGRFQSVLLDRRSLIVSYDPRRGEPRGKGAKRDGLGDCVDCGLCVATCPTGIDIREGLQMECLHCAQCIDACDAVMEKVGRPRGLIRYSSQEAVETGSVRLFRPRVLLYPVILLGLLAAFGWVLGNRQPADVDFLRVRSTPYHLKQDGSVESALQVKITNRTEAERSYTIDVPGASWFSSDLPLRLPPRGSGVALLHVALPRDRFVRGRADVTVVVTDGASFRRSYRHHVLGPLFGGAPPEGTQR